MQFSFGQGEGAVAAAVLQGYRGAVLLAEQHGTDAKVLPGEKFAAYFIATGSHIPGIADKRGITIGHARRRDGGEFSLSFSAQLILCLHGLVQSFLYYTRRRCKRIS